LSSKEGDFFNNKFLHIIMAENKVVFIHLQITNQSQMRHMNTYKKKIHNLIQKDLDNLMEK
jgi:hypothetical protein